MIAIVPFSKEHQQGVVDTILPIQTQEFGVPITLADQPDLLDIPGFYQRGNGQFWVAVYEGWVVGTLALLDIGNREGALRKMFVQAAFRGREHGVSGNLLATLLAWAASRKLHAIYLGTTERFLAAHRFYERNGFTEIPAAELPPAFPVMAVDRKFYRRLLDGGQG